MGDLIQNRRNLLSDCPALAPRPRHDLLVPLEQRDGRLGAGRYAVLPDCAFEDYFHIRHVNDTHVQFPQSDFEARFMLPHNKKEDFLGFVVRLQTAASGGFGRRQKTCMLRALVHIYIMCTRDL